VGNLRKVVSPISRRWWALAALSLAVLAAGIDATVLVVALPTLATAFHASETDLQWFSSGYLLTLAAGVLPAGLLGDRYGRRLAMLIALVLFGVGSVACAFAPSAGVFVAARALLGLAAAGVIVMALSALTVLFTPQERPRAVGVWSAVNFLSQPVGPLLGGWLLTHYWWGWVFLINVPVSAIAIVALLALVPESRDPARPRLDTVGIATATAGLLALTYGFIRAGEHGWGDAVAWVAIAAGTAFLAGFVARQKTTKTPLIEAGAPYAWSVVLLFIAVMAMMGVLFTMPQYFQAVAGTDAIGSGIRLLPLIGGLVVGALPADRLARQLGANIAGGIGFATMAAGLLVGVSTRTGTGAGTVAAWMALVGAGMGLTMATATSSALSELAAEQGGIGSAVLQAGNKLGGPFGAAILGSVLTTTYRAHLDLTGIPADDRTAARASVFDAIRLGDASAPAAFVRGLDNALLVSAVFAVVGIGLATAFLRRRSSGSP
jgi:DHA2 family multidrug resistance protein-like MFS transporter